MKTSQNFPEIRRKSCENCTKIHRISATCVDVNIKNIYTPQQADDTACPLFTETKHEHFPAITLEIANG